MRNERGIASGIGDLSEFPMLNRPYETDYESTTPAHIRALSAFVAQLHARVIELERDRPLWRGGDSF